MLVREGCSPPSAGVRGHKLSGEQHVTQGTRRDPGVSNPAASRSPPSSSKVLAHASSPTTATCGFRHVYSVEVFTRIGATSQRSSLPVSTLAVTTKLWRIPKQRWLESKALGILHRLTRAKYAASLQELTSLPFGQLANDEIAEVVRAMFDEAASKRHPVYLEFYAQLMADWVRSADPPRVGGVIQTAITEELQRQFKQYFRLSDLLFDMDGHALPEDKVIIQEVDADLWPYVNILGNLFLFGMVRETFVNLVLLYLLYGRQKQIQRRPAHYALRIFCDLLRKVAKALSPETYSTYVPGYMKTLKSLTAKAKPLSCALLTDMEKLYKNNWEAECGGDAASHNQAPTAPPGRPSRTTPKSIHAIRRHGENTAVSQRSTHQQAATESNG